MRGWVFLCLLSSFAGAEDVDPDTQAAKRHFERGRQLYEEGRYDDALAEFDTSRKLKPLPELLFNIARTEERRENWGAAADAYEKYLQELPGAPDAAELQKRIVVLRSRTQLRPPLPVAPSAPLPPARKSRLHLAAGAMLAVAVVTAGLGGVLVGTVDGGFQDLEQTCALKQCVPSDWASLQTRANIGYAFVGIAGAAALTDVVLWVIDYRRSKPATHARWEPAGLGVTF